MDSRNFSHLLKTKSNRKEARKQKKQLKKIVKIAHSSRQKVEDVVQTMMGRKIKPTKSSERSSGSGDGEKKKKKRKKTKSSESTPNPTMTLAAPMDAQLRKFNEEAAVVNRQRMEEDIEADDAEIAYYEKLLGKKRKKKTTKRTQADEEDS